jgi:thioester reductase-like protein
MGYLLLTGSTGLIGRYLLRDLLLAEIPVVTVARATNQEESVARIEKIILEWERALKRKLPRPHCIAGDLHQPGLGLDRSTRDWLSANCRSTIHNAGNVSFHSTAGDEEPWRTNVGGTRHLIELCHDIGIEAFHYMSTAYACGNRNGLIMESDVDCGQSFESDYEDSKLAAEVVARSAGFPKLNILRPSSVIGDSQTGYTSTYHGVYLFAQFTYLAQVRAGAKPGEPWNHPVRLFQTGKETHHLVPVDSVSKATVEIVRQQDLAGATYHLTPVKPCTCFELEAALAAYFGYYGVTFADPAELHRAQLNEIEQLFYDAMSRAQHRYLSGDPQFDCSNTIAAVPGWDQLRVKQEDLLRIFDFAVKHRFGKLRNRQRAL